MTVKQKIFSADGWLKVIATIATVIVAVLGGVWRVAAYHAEAMAAINRQGAEIADLKEIENSHTELLRSVVTHAELDRELMRHSQFPHPNGVTAKELEGLREDIRDLQQELRRRMP